MAATIYVEEIVHRLNQIITALKRYIHIKHIQHAKFNFLKFNLQGNEVLIQIDCSENNANQDQNQIQSVYFGQSCFSIFTACCYLPIDRVLVNKNITVTFEASDHSMIAALSCWLRVLSDIKEKYQNLPDSLVLHILSDRCTGQLVIFRNITSGTTERVLWTISVVPSNIEYSVMSSLRK